MLAARVRILEKDTYHDIDGSLQAHAIRRHCFHCEVLQRNVHYPSQALSQARWAVGDRVYRRDRRLFRRAATERHEVFHDQPEGQGPRDVLSDVALPTDSAVPPRVVAARWQHGTGARSVLRRDAPVFRPGYAIAAYRSEPMGHTRTGSGTEVAGGETPFWIGDMSNDYPASLSDLFSSPCESRPCVLPPYLPGVGIDMASYFACLWDTLQELLDTAATHTQFIHALEHKNEKLFLKYCEREDMESSACRSLAEQAKLIDSQFDVLTCSVAALGQQVSELRSEITDEVPSVTLVNAKLDAMRGLLRCSCAQLRDDVAQQLQLARAYCDDSFAKLDVSTSSNLARLLDKPLAKLWDDCQELVNASRDEVSEFMSRIRDQLMLDAADQVSACVRSDVAQSLAKIKQDMQEHTAQTHGQVVVHEEALHKIQQNMREHTALVATHEEALRQMAAMLGTIASRNTELISHAVGSAMTQLLESGVISSAVRVEIARASVSGTRPRPPAPDHSPSDDDGGGSLDEEWYDADGQRCITHWSR